MNIKRLQQLAGLRPLHESWAEDEDDMSPSERALAAKADKDLAKKGIKVKADPDKDMEVAAKQSNAEHEKRKAEKKAAKAAPAPKAEEKKEAPVADAKKKGRPASASSKSGGARGWMSSNKDATRGQFVAHATKELGMTAAHASTLFYALKRKMNEAYVIRHPNLGTYALAENKMMNMYAWIDLKEDNQLEPLLHVSEAAAQKTLKFIRDYKSFDGVIVKIV